jgi:hypothetical protein
MLAEHLEQPQSQKRFVSKDTKNQISSQKKLLRVFKDIVQVEIELNITKKIYKIIVQVLILKNLYKNLYNSIACKQTQSCLKDLLAMQSRIGLNCLVAQVA